MVRNISPLKFFAGKKLCRPVVLLPLLCLLSLALWPTGSALGPASLNSFNPFDPLPALAQAPVSAEEASPEPVKAKLVSDGTGIVPGGKFKLGVQFDIQPGWHTYYKDPGDSGMPPNFTWTLPAGFSAGPILWQKPHKTVEAEIVAYGYEGTVLHVSELSAPADLKVGAKVTFKVKVKYLTCKEICLPGKADLEITLPVVASPAAVGKSAEAPAFDAVGGGFNDPVSTLSVTPPGDHQSASAGAPAADDHSANDKGGNSGGGENKSGKVSVLDQNYGASESLVNYILPAFLGGLILNVMPCVLPVIAIKVLSLLEQAKEEPAKIKLLGLVFAAGIISSFMVLALTVIAIKAAGQSVGWGFQFQYPGFVVIMAAVILLMSLSLFGLFYVNVQASGQIDKLARQEGLVGTFFKGVLATVLSTPCTAPFLGAALGFAFAQPAQIIALIFFTVALGMASPYLLLTINPKWMKFLPKPGDWMDKFKQSMGFVMLGTVIWLDYVLASELSAMTLMWVNFWFVGVAFCAWIIASFSDLSSSQTRRNKVFASAAATFALFTYICFFLQPGVIAALLPGSSATAGSADHRAMGVGASASGVESGVDSGAVSGSPPPARSGAIADSNEYGINWEPFTVQKLNDALSDKKTVFLDFTADWCLTCKVNEKTVLATKAVSEQLKALHVVTMKADWTKQDADITKLLNKFNRSGVPLYVIFPGNHPDKPIVLPEVIDQSLVIAKLQEAVK
ncbi:MAG: thioredoxin family protein [Cyanobacteria bacterium REEB67]|nr:thioredoxin family protein [Cyanobacteria bacterium REEB67]